MGGGQGDALTGLCYAIAIYPIMRECSHLYPNVNLRGIQDDCTLGGRNRESKPEVCDAWLYLAREFEKKVGLRINTSKTQSYIVGTQDHGMTICSIPVGDKNYVIESFRKTVEEYIATIRDITNRLASIDSHVTYTVVKISL